MENITVCKKCGHHEFATVAAGLDYYKIVGGCLQFTRNETDGAQPHDEIMCANCGESASIIK